MQQNKNSTWCRALFFRSMNQVKQLVRPLFRFCSLRNQVEFLIRPIHYVELSFSIVFVACVAAVIYCPKRNFNVLLSVIRWETEKCCNKWRMLDSWEIFHFFHHTIDTDVGRFCWSFLFFCRSICICRLSSQLTKKYILCTHEMVIMILNDPLLST